MEKEKLDKSNVQGKPLERQRPLIDDFIARKQAAGILDADTGQLYNQGTFVRELLDGFFATDSAASGLSEEHFDRFREELDLKFAELHRTIQNDLCQFFKAVLLNNKLLPEKVGHKLLRELINQMFKKDVHV